MTMVVAKRPASVSRASAVGASGTPVAAAGPVPDGARLGRETLADRLAQQLSRQIESAQLKPGDRLPTEAQLALQHGVSRSVVREAVHRIKSRGLLLSRQGSGVFVAPPAQNQPLQFDPRVLGSVQAVVHVAEVRRALEGEMAALAAERATRSQIAGIRRALVAIDTAAASGADGVAEDLAFHRAIGEATGNPQFSLLLAFLEQYLREGMRVTRGNEARRSDFMEEVRQEHKLIVDALAARDPAAARRAATQHLRHGQRRLEVGGVISPTPARARRLSPGKTSKPASSTPAGAVPAPRKRTRA